MPRRRRPVPVGIEVKPVTLLLDGAVRASGRTMTDVAKDAGLSKSSVAWWCQGWRPSHDRIIAAVPADNDDLARLALVLGVRPRDLEKLGYAYAARVVREKGGRPVGGDPFARFTTKQLADEVARRLEFER